MFGDKNARHFGGAGFIRQRHFFIVGIKQLRAEIILRQDITVTVSVVAKAIRNVEIHDDTIYTICLRTGFVAVIVLIRYIGDVVNDELNFTVLLNGNFHHAGVLPIAFFIFQRQAYPPGIEFFLVGFIRAVLPGRQYQIPVVVVPFGKGVFFDNRHHQRTCSIVFRLPGGSNDFVMMINERVNGPLTFFQPDGCFWRIFNHALGMFIRRIGFQPQSDIEGIFLFVFQNNKVVTFNKVVTTAHERVSRAHFVRIKLIFERDTKLVVQRCVNRKIGIIASASFVIRSYGNERYGLVFHTQRDGEGIFLQIIGAKKRDFITVILFENDFTAKLRVSR